MKNEEEQRDQKSIDRKDAIIKDSIVYGAAYGLEDGLETGMKQGLEHGLQSGITNALINGTEEAVEDVMEDVMSPNAKKNEDSLKKKKFKRIISIIKIVVVVLVLFWIGMRLSEAWNEIVKYDWQINIFWLIMASLLYLAAFFPASVLWYLSLRWMGQTPDFFTAVNAFYTSQLGKYLPGKAMVVIIRSAMVASEKVKVSIAAVCVFYETLTMMTTGAFLASLVIVIWFREHYYYSLLALGTMVLSGLPLVPPIFIRILSILRISKYNPDLNRYLHAFTWRSIFTGSALMTLLWILFGISLWAAIQGIGIVPGEFLANLPRYISVTALAIVLGFAVPIAPGGLGIREAVLSILLIPYFDMILTLPENNAVHVQADTLALIVSLEQRIISIIAELSLVAFFFLFRMIPYYVTRTNKSNHQKTKGINS